MKERNSKLFLSIVFVTVVTAGLTVTIVPFSAFAQQNGLNGASGGNGGTGGNAHCNSSGGTVTNGEKGHPANGSNGGNGGNGGSANCTS
ncbi:MAG TPA: hypothetical protein VN704_02500 [Verrucomicrobiae bacterium]|nr:hypothetical protein [Verrucomicrobiae bacterium]